MSQVVKILLTEPGEIAQSAIDLLTASGYSVLDSLDGIEPQQVDGLFIRTYTKANKQYLAKFENLQFILRAGVGLDNIDLVECKARGIQVFNSPGANADAVAEYALTMSLYALRGIGPQIAQVQKDAWRSEKYVGCSLSSQTFGLIGCGHAGRALAIKLAGLGVPCLGYDPYVTQATLTPLRVTKVELAELLSRADIVVIMLPLTPETTGIMNADRLKAMKPRSILINVSRGEMIDDPVLIEQLGNGHLRCAVLDVVAGEPNVSSALHNVANLIITPHIAGYTKEANENIATQAVRNFLAVWSKS